jgi:predicted phage-related endonuclease
MTEVGELITPTGVLVLPADRLGGDEWLQARRWRRPDDIPGCPTGDVGLDLAMGYRIGSSDVPSILDLDGVDTPAHVYREKVFGIEGPANENMRWGSVFEHSIAMEWCRRNRAVIDEIGLIARMDKPWRQSTIDRRVRECPVHKDAGLECGLEAKHVEHVYEPRWRTENGLPDRITAQIIDQLLNTGYAHMHYAVKIPGDFKMGIIYRDREQQLMSYIDGAVEAFRKDYLLAGVEPPWNLAKADKLIALDNATHPERDGVAELDIDGIGDVMAYAEAAAMESAGRKRKKQLAAALREHANGAAVVTFAGERVYSYRMDNRAPEVDLQQLKERWPDAYDACVTQKQSPTLIIDKAYRMRGERS